MTSSARRGTPPSPNAVTDGSVTPTRSERSEEVGRRRVFVKRPDRSDKDLVAAREAFALYELDEVRTALGLPTGSPLKTDDDLEEDMAPSDTEHRARLREILNRGDLGRWRRALVPTAGVDEAVGRLSEKAPHFADLSNLVRTSLRAAANMCVPIFLPPVLLVGPPGVGKTWFLSRLAATLGVPFRSYAMNASTLGEGLQGAHPSWRNAAPGLVAKTLLAEPVANCIFFIDEFDKAQAGGYNVDPYRPFYTLLDPSGSSAFVDEYLSFGIDASRALWVIAANDCRVVPAPILDRLTVLEVPEMTVRQRIAVVASIYADANAARYGFFVDTPSPQVIGGLATMSPRSIRITLDDAMSRAAADGRREVRESDVRPRQVAPAWHAGFR